MVPKTNFWKCQFSNFDLLLWFLSITCSINLVHYRFLGVSRVHYNCIMRVCLYLQTGILIANGAPTINIRDGTFIFHHPNISTDLLINCGLTFYTHPAITCKTLQMVWGPMKFIESTLYIFVHFFSAKSNFKNQSTGPNPHGWLVCSSKIYFDIPKPSAVA